MRILPFDYAVRNLARSPGRLAATVLAGALVAGLVLAAAAFIQGMARALVISSDAANVILMAVGSEDSLERSQIPANSGSVVAADLPGIKTLLGVPHVSPEIHVALSMRTEPGGADQYSAIVRGFASEAFLVHPRVQMTEGRVPQPGQEEIMTIGRGRSWGGFRPAAR
jgi:putative ABC transport system permease protein